MLEKIETRFPRTLRRVEQAQVEGGGKGREWDAVGQRFQGAEEETGEVTSLASAPESWPARGHGLVHRGEGTSYASGAKPRKPPVFANEICLRQQAKNKTLGHQKQLVSNL